jgi:hypothetical protein
MERQGERHRRQSREVAVSEAGAERIREHSPAGEDEFLAPLERTAPRNPRAVVPESVACYKGVPQRLTSPSFSNLQTYNPFGWLGP